MTQALLLFAWYPVAVAAFLLDARLQDRGVLRRGEKLPIAVCLVLLGGATAGAHAVDAPEVATAVLVAPAIWCVVMLGYMLARGRRVHLERNTRS